MKYFLSVAIFASLFFIAGCSESETPQMDNDGYYTIQLCEDLGGKVEGCDLFTSPEQTVVNCSCSNGKKIGRVKDTEEGASCCK